MIHRVLLLMTIGLVSIALQCVIDNSPPSNQKVSSTTGTALPHDSTLSSQVGSITNQTSSTSFLSTIPSDTQVYIVDGEYDDVFTKELSDELYQLVSNPGGYRDYAYHNFIPSAFFDTVVIQTFNSNIRYYYFEKEGYLTQADFYIVNEDGTNYLSIQLYYIDSWDYNYTSYNRLGQILKEESPAEGNTYDENGNLVYSYGHGSYDRDDAYYHYYSYNFFTYDSINNLIKEQSLAGGGDDEDCNAFEQYCCGCYNLETYYSCDADCTTTLYNYDQNNVIIEKDVYSHKVDFNSDTVTDCSASFPNIDSLDINSLLSLSTWNYYTHKHYLGEELIDYSETIELLSPSCFRKIYPYYDPDFDGDVAPTFLYWNTLLAIKADVSNTSPYHLINFGVDINSDYTYETIIDDPDAWISQIQVQCADQKATVLWNTAITTHQIHTANIVYGVKDSADKQTIVADFSLGTALIENLEYNTPYQFDISFTEEDQAVEVTIPYIKAHIECEMTFP